MFSIFRHISERPILCELLAPLWGKMPVGRKGVFYLLFLFLPLFSYAQNRVVSGTVSDDMGPIMMANVVEKDANNRIISATQTDMMGNFSMEVKNPKNKLEITYVGCKKYSVTIGDKTTFEVMLTSESTNLKEIVVKGTHGTSGGLNIAKKEITVAQSTFNLSEVEGMAFTSADEALQGEIAGLDIVANSGNLGAGTTMRLRGVTTINGNAEPLIVVDGKIFDNPDKSFDFQNASEEEYSSLLSVNVEDIAKIDVLKDAAATAVWGARGANGVIEITTKRGSRGKPRVNFSYKFTGTWQPKDYDLLKGDDYTMLIKEEYYNPNQSNTATSNIREINYDKSWADFENWNNNIDWVKEVTKFGPQHSYNLNITGGGQKATFRISGGYDNQENYIIKQHLDRLSTRLVLDYNVSDRIRFSTNFALTYTDNQMNYYDIVNQAQKMAPNMSVYKQDAYGNDTNQFYIMNTVGSLNDLTPYTGNYSSYELRSIQELGNPVANAELSWKRDETYRITPDFNIKYELLGTATGQTRLTFNGRVDFDIYARTVPAYVPAEIASITWDSSPLQYNFSEKTESNRLKIGALGEFVFTPYFKNEDISMTMLARYEMSTQRSNSQYVAKYNLPNGITSVTSEGALLYTTIRTKTYNGLGDGSSRSNSQNMIYNAHFSYKQRYNLGFSLRADGDSKFGPKQKWAYFPGVSLRYNISDENFFEPLRKHVSMVGLRASWGINGKAPDADYLFYNTYSTSTGAYGSASKMDGLRLDDLRWEKTTSYNLGFNLGFLDDIIEVDFDFYHKDTKDLLQKVVAIPTTTGYASLAYQNVGGMKNDGWELNISGNKFLKIGKFSMSAGFNIAQNYNEITEMDDRVLNAINSDWIATKRGEFLNRVQTGNALGSIYGFRYKGVYQYSFDYLKNYNSEQMQSNPAWTTSDYENWINSMLADGKTMPVVTGTDGKVVMDNNGQPKRIVYNYNSGAATYTFQGGDAIYEDINHDGQINALDIVYLGNSMPKLQGGFHLTLLYGGWNLKARFTYRWGNKIVNAARRDLESMSGAYNQCATVNWRWRKDGDVTMIPRAMYVYDDNSAYNYQGSSRFVEDGSFLRFQNLQVGYNFPKKDLKKYGLNQLQFYVTMNNLFCWTKYSGVDPEISVGGWGVAIDNKTARSKSFTANVVIGF